MLWKTYHTPLQIAQNQVDIWKGYLDLPLERYNALFETLSFEEKKRADQYASVKDRHSFIAARGYLRTILSIYMQIPPKQITIGYEDFGKPYFKNDRNLNFNLSHASGIVLYAFTKGMRVGIDLECMLQPLEMEETIMYYFTEEEKKVMENQKPAEKINRFLQIWTTKESLAKGVGKGLSFRAEHPTSWSTFNFEPEKNYIAALSTEEPVYLMNHWLI